MSSIELELGFVRFRVTGSTEFVTKEFHGFLDKLLDGQLDSVLTGASAPMAGTTQDVIAPGQEPPPEDLPEWVIKISAKCKIAYGYIETFFYEDDGYLVIPEWPKKSSAKEDGPSIALIMLYANKIGLGHKELSSRKIKAVLRSLGIGDLTNQSTHIKAEPGIILKGQHYKINPAGEKKAVVVLKSQIPDA